MGGEEVWLPRAVAVGGATGGILMLAAICSADWINGPGTAPPRMNGAATAYCGARARGPDGRGEGEGAQRA